MGVDTRWVKNDPPPKKNIDFYKKILNNIYVKRVSKTE